MGAVQVSSKVAQKLRAFQIQIERLPASERPLWKARVAKKLATKPGWAVSGFNADAAAPVKPATEKEWDLQLANWLDGAYTVVSDRVEEVAKKGAEAASIAGFSLWPIALAAVGIAWAMSSARGGAKR